MMVNEDALAAAKAAHRPAHLLDHADRLMAEHQRRLAPDVPGHDIARADAAGAGADQNFVGPGGGTRVLLDADIAEVVEPCNLHLSGELWGPRGPMSNAAALIINQRLAVIFAGVGSYRGFFRPCSRTMGFAPDDAARGDAC